jgi:hypothetical protein
MDSAPQVLRFLRDFAPDAPDELGITVSMMLAPPLPFLPPERVGKPVIGLVLVWAGDPGDGAKAMAPLRALGTPIADVIRPVPYLFLQSMLDGGVPHGRHYYWKAHRLATLSDTTIDLCCERLASTTTPFAQINGWAVGGAVSRVDPDATAVGAREVGFEISLAAAWPATDPNGERHRNWVRQGWEALRPQSSGVYANFISDEGEAGVQAAYGERVTRLTGLKNRYDPTNFFRLNANIPPSRPTDHRDGGEGR